AVRLDAAWTGVRVGRASAGDSREDCGLREERGRREWAEGFDAPSRRLAGRARQDRQVPGVSRHGRPAGPQGPQGGQGRAGPWGAREAAGPGGPSGPAGPSGVLGPAGPTGAAGAGGVSGWTYVVAPMTLPAPSDARVIAPCPNGTKPLGGGWS